MQHQLIFSVNYLILLNLIIITSKQIVKLLKLHPYVSLDILCDTELVTGCFILKLFCMEQ